jgi:outer membrane protein assembly factor BamD
MPIPFLRRRLLPLWIAAACALCVTDRLAADLTWSPGTGWQVEGGALEGLTGTKGTKALDLMNKARADEEAGSLHSAIRNYHKVASKYQGSIYAPEALYRAGMLLVKRKQLFDAFTDFQQVLRRYPNTKRFNDVIGEEYHIAAILLDGGRNWTWGWIPDFPNRTRGTEFMEVIVLNAPYSDYAPLALMEAARGNQLESNTEEAIDALDRLVNTYPQSVLAPVAYLKLGDLHASLTEGPKYDQASTKEAMTYYEDFMILYPGDAGIAKAADGVDKMKTILANSKIYIGDYYFYKRFNYEAAKIFYNEAITAYPDSAPARFAKKRLAELESRVVRQSIHPMIAPPKKRFFFF